MMKFSFVIPCYNEREGIPKLFEALEDARQTLGPTYEWELVFVDDGSVDGTAKLLWEAFRGHPNVQVIRHASNRGLGAALRTGFEHATGDLIATADSDCTYEPREVGAMLRLIEQGADIVVASQYHPYGRVKNVPAYRLLLSRNLSHLYRWVLGSELYTYTGLFRLYRTEVLRTIRFKSDGFLAVAELLVEALLRGYRVVEYPTQLTVREYGQSKAVISRLVIDHLRFLWQLARRRSRLSSRATTTGGRVATEQTTPATKC